MMLKRFDADLHIHTCLSPCGETTMSPKRIVEQAKLKGLNIIGICDHNSAENVVFAKKAGEKEGLSVIGGMEITTQEEVHLKKGKLWRIHYWILKREQILRMARMEEKPVEKKDDFSAVYDEISEEAWDRS